VLLGSRDRMSNHASDALAVALCHVLASPLLKVTS
jgi:Holliday junction resolvasome RuvABC endonuclease subunit